MVSKGEQRCHDIVTCFKPTPFEPFPLANPHFQTICSHIYPVPPQPQYSRLTLDSDDGLATFSVDIANGSSLSPTNTSGHDTIAPPPRDEEEEQQVISSPTIEGQGGDGDSSLNKSQPVAVVLTGLESNSNSPVTCRIVHALTSMEDSPKVIVLNYRSCAADENGNDHTDVPTTFRLYHAGFTEDLEVLLRMIRQSAERCGYIGPDVFLCGFSLGANVMCNFLGKFGDVARRDFGVIGAAGACVPFDPASCQLQLDSGWKGFIYSAFLIRRMRSKFEAIYATGVDSTIYDLAKVRAATRLGHIDDYYISPTFGFANRQEYYKSIDARQFLRHITVPTLIINALDDPFFAHYTGSGLPSDQDISNAPLLLNISKHGGHCAFLDRETFQDPTTGYFQREFARWFQHILQHSR